MKRVRIRPGKRFHLLLYNRLYDSVRWPLLLLLLALGGLWWYSPFIMFLATSAEWLAYTAGLCLLLFVATYATRFLSYVQCRPDHLRIQTPIFRLAISYGRIQTVRPVKFGEQYPAAKQRWSQRRFLEPLFGLTAVGVSVHSYPIALRWLKIWLNDYLFLRDAPGFLFLVEDWMTLSREIDVYRDRWRDRRQNASQAGSFSMNPFLKR